MRRIYKLTDYSRANCRFRVIWPEGNYCNQKKEFEPDDIELFLENHCNDCDIYENITDNKELEEPEETEAEAEETEETNNNIHIKPIQLQVEIEDGIDTQAAINILKQRITEALQYPFKITDTIDEDIQTINQTLQPTLKYTPKNTDNPHIKEIPIPEEAYTKNGELKPEYRQELQKIIQENRNKYLKKPEPTEIIDSNTADIQHIINQIINNTGIINYLKIRLPQTLLQTLLLTLSQHTQELNENHLNWHIQEYCEDEIELTLERL